MSVLQGIVLQPPPRTFIKAREQVQFMVRQGVANQSIKNYLLRLCRWWKNTVENLSVENLVWWFIENVNQDCLKLIAQSILKNITSNKSQSYHEPALARLTQGLF